MQKISRVFSKHIKDFEDISIRKLTYKNPTMRAKIEEARKQNGQIEVKD